MSSKALDLALNLSVPIVQAMQTPKVAPIQFISVAESLVSSKVLKAVIFSGMAALVLFGVMHILGSPHIWWMYTAVSVGALIPGLFIFSLQNPKKTLQQISFELSSFARLFKKENYNEIRFNKAPGQGKILLGALPNHYRAEGEHLVNEERVSAVLSINEAWERVPRGPSLPYTKEEWETLRVNYEEMDALDHEVVSLEDIKKGAAAIHKQVSTGKNIFIHCRAGRGRSATLIAGYFIEYKAMTPEQACNAILASRPSSTVFHKLTRLEEYWHMIFQEGQHGNP